MEPACLRPAAGLTREDVWAACWATLVAVVVAVLALLAGLALAEALLNGVCSGWRDALARVPLVAEVGAWLFEARAVAAVVRDALAALAPVGMDVRVVVRASGLACSAPAPGLSALTLPSGDAVCLMAATRAVALLLGLALTVTAAALGLAALRPVVPEWAMTGVVLADVLLVVLPAAVLVLPVVWLRVDVIGLRVVAMGGAFVAPCRWPQ